MPDKVYKDKIHMDLINSPNEFCGLIIFLKLAHITVDLFASTTVICTNSYRHGEWAA